MKKDTKNLIEHKIGDIVDFQINKVREGDLELKKEKGGVILVAKDEIKQTSTPAIFRVKVLGINDKNKILEAEVVGAGTIESGIQEQENPEKIQKVSVFYLGKTNYATKDSIEQWENYVIPFVNNSGSAETVTGSVVRCEREE